MLAAYALYSLDTYACLASDVRERAARHIFDQQSLCGANEYWSSRDVATEDLCPNHPLITGVARPKSCAGARAECRSKLIAVPSTERLAVPLRGQRPVRRGRTGRELVAKTKPGRSSYPNADRTQRLPRLLPLDKRGRYYFQREQGSSSLVVCGYKRLHTAQWDD